MGPLFLIWKKSLVFLLEGLGFDIRHWLWHHLKTSSESNPSSLDRQSLLLNSKFSKPKMMSCSFERLQFLEYYQEKKVIFLEFSPPSRCPRRKLFLRAAWATLLAGKLSFHFIFPTHSQALEALMSLKISDCSVLTSPQKFQDYFIPATSKIEKSRFQDQVWSENGFLSFFFF